jgi:hypothetical protein
VVVLLSALNPLLRHCDTVHAATIDCLPGKGLAAIGIKLVPALCLVVHDAVLLLTSGARAVVS